MYRVRSIVNLHCMLSMLYLVQSCILLCNTSSDNHHDITSFLDTIERDFDWRFRPTHEDPLVVEVTMYIDNIYEISEKDMSYKMQLNLCQLWNDWRLEYDNYPEPMVLVAGYHSRIWTPDLYFANAKSSRNHSITQPNSFVRLFRNGNVFYCTRLTVQANCQTEISQFPFDNQKCLLSLESFAYTEQDLVLKWAETPLYATDEISLSAFVLINWKMFENTHWYTTGNYTSLVVVLNLGRDLLFFMTSSFFPCAIIVIISWMSFWIQCSSNSTSARAYMGATSVLSMLILTMGTRKFFPQYAYINAIDVFYLINFIYVIAALAEFAAVTYIGNPKVKHPVKKGVAETTFNIIGEGAATVENRTTTTTTTNEELDDQQQQQQQPQQANSYTHPNCTTGTRLLRRHASNSSITSNDPRPVKPMTNAFFHKSFWLKGRNTTKPRMNINVNQFDKYSRVVFPVSYLFINIIYWWTYIGKNEEDDWSIYGKEIAQIMGPSN